MRCIQCKTEKETTAFYKAPRGFRVRKCFDCARSNMRAYEAKMIATNLAAVKSGKDRRETKLQTPDVD